jgi:hypothetical protein
MTGNVLPALALTGICVRAEIDDALLHLQPERAILRPLAHGDIRARQDLDGS